MVIIALVIFQPHLKVKQSHNIVMELQGVEDVQLLLIHDLVTKWGEWSASRPDRASPQGKGSPEPIVQKAWWAPEPVWTQRLEEKSLVSAWIEPQSPGPQSDTIPTEIPGLLYLI
jgi:hypothetical protein